VTLFDTREPVMDTWQVDQDIDGLQAADIDRIAMEMARARNPYRKTGTYVLIIPITDGDINWVCNKLEPILRKHAYQRY
jgi:hypothetical protein